MKWYLRAGVVGCMVLAAGQAARADWNTTQGDAAHDGYVAMNVSSSAPQMLWSTQLPNVINESDLAVGGGQVFVTAQDATTSHWTEFYALNEQTGGANWHMTLSSVINTGNPAYANGAVYLQTVGNGQSLMQGWNATTQAPVFSASYANQFNTYLAPVVDNGSLYAGGGYYGGAYSYSTATSGTNWSNTSGNFGSYGNWSPAVDANYVYASGGGGGSLFILNKATGALVGSAGPNEEAGSSSAILTGNGGLFYVENGTGHFVDISQPTAPSVVWSKAGEYEGDAAAYHNGVLYVPIAGAALDAIDATTGDVLWSLTGIGGWHNLIVTDNALFAEQGTNTVAVSLATHQVMWSVPERGDLAVSDNILFIAQNAGLYDTSGAAGYLYAYSVPEPATAAVGLLAVAGLMVRRRR